MRVSLSNSVSFFFVSLLLCLFGRQSLAADADSEVQWFVNLVKTYNGKAFCPPPSATFNDLASALSKFSKAHPELHGQLTDQQAIQGIAESYPCTVQATPSLANTERSQIGAKKLEITPTGEYTSIDIKPTIAIMQKLRSTSAHGNDNLVGEITKNSGNYMPPVLFALADLFYRRGDFDNAIYWFNAARVRGNFDATLCTDISARSAISALVQQMPRELIKTQFADIPRLKDTIDRVLKWDETTPYNYDHRWISLHGMNAINNGLGNPGPSGPLTVPRDSWDALAKTNRDQYRKSLDEAIDMVQKQRAAK